MKQYQRQRITAPVLTISAPNDLYSTYDAALYTAEQIPGARFVAYLNGGHLLVGHRQRAMDEIVRFLKSQ